MLLLCAFARIEADRTQVGALEGEAEITDAVFDETFDSGGRSRTIIRLHENGAKPVSAPIRFEEGELLSIITGEARAGGDASFNFVE